MNENLRRHSGLDGYRHRDKFPRGKFGLSSGLRLKLSFSSKAHADRLTLILQEKAIIVQYQRILKCLTSLSPPTTHLCAYAHRHLCNLSYLRIALKQDFSVLSPHCVEKRLFRFFISKDVYVRCKDTFAYPKFLTHPYLHFYVWM